MTGNSIVSQVSASRQERRFRRLLTTGDHFGEIGCLFNCNRTCTVMSIDYSILARISKPRLRMLVSDYPEYLIQLVRHMCSYKDQTKQLIFQAFEQIDYLKGLNKFMFHEISYSFKERLLEDKEVLIKEQELIDQIFIVKSGELEVFKEVDGNEFVFCKIRAGAVLNSRNVVFDHEKSKVSVRCSRRAQILVLHLKDLKTIALQN